jgi:hypothetical protein
MELLLQEDTVDINRTSTIPSTNDVALSSAKNELDPKSSESGL